MSTANLRLAIVGGPKCGKTTLACALSAQTPHIWHTDLMLDKVFTRYDPESWSKQSDEVAYVWLKKPAPWVIEGVPVIRGLRKFLIAFPLVKPCDRVIWLGKPHVELKPRQAALLQTNLALWKLLKPKLEYLGVEVAEF